MSRIRIERDLAYLLSLSLSRLLYSTCRGIHRDRESAISQSGDQGCPVSSSPLENHILRIQESRNLLF